MSGGGGESVGSGGWSRGSGPRCRMAAAVRMNIQMLLEAADYLERRERGARGREESDPSRGRGLWGSPLRVQEPDRSGGGWRGGERYRERSQPLQLSPRAVRREAARCPKGNEWRWKGGRCTPGSRVSPLPNPSRVACPRVPSARPLVYLTGLVPSAPRWAWCPVSQPEEQHLPVPPPLLPVFDPHLRLRLVPLNTPAGRCQWETQAPCAERLAGSFSTMSSWNAPYTCSELRVFTQFKKQLLF